ncbi:hypothetical protein [Chryseobacterium lathyri]|uniref:Uncharacterized protein n=1 Tax=Chryseobacterium lathyri TaxID=395933 RepID=A0A511YG22_9FLAO|nr:hypothetical protein [Chryseobacterium lathyri]GEN74123.1 hypothetical protein CLA01_41950 [Chryseobacterium lathyri]
MKKIYAALIFISSLVYSQTNEVKYYFEKSDLNYDTTNKQIVKFTNHVTKYIQLRNGENNFSTVKVDLFGDPDLSQFDLTKLNKVIDVISENAKYNLKSPSTYIPNAIVLRRNKNEWFTNVFFSGQNSYGAKKDNSSMVTLDDEGNIIKDFEK